MIATIQRVTIEDETIELPDECPHCGDQLVGHHRVTVHEWQQGAWANAMVDDDEPDGLSYHGSVPLEVYQDGQIIVGYACSGCNEPLGDRGTSFTLADG